MITTWLLSLLYTIQIEILFGLHDHWKVFEEIPCKEGNIVSFQVTLSIILSTVAITICISIYDNCFCYRNSNITGRKISDTLSIAYG